ncbi:MAG: hypothetical protein L3K07_03440 [Thermoplasmata archaeon]|nr:hypothetical protein [Thermoplasmata archaeon]
MSRSMAIPFPAAIALLSAALVFSIWASFGLGNPLFLVLGAVGVALLASLYLFSYSRRPLQDPLAQLVAPEEFDDPVIEADLAAGNPEPVLPPSEVGGEDRQNLDAAGASEKSAPPETLASHDPQQ